MTCARSLMGGILLTWSLPCLASIGVLLAAPGDEEVPWRREAGIAKADSDKRVLAPVGQPTIREYQKRDRPWWDFMGVTGPPDPPTMKPAPSTPSRRGARRPASPGSGSQKSPWWDWAGVSKDKKPSAARPPTPRPPAGMPKTAGPPVKHPWWDWMKLTPGQYDMSRRQGRIASTKVDRPWWDWSGVTDNTYKPGQRDIKKRSTLRGPAPQQPKRPWWDWAGVTEDKSKSSKPTGRSVVRKQPQKADRPWWDWTGVTEDKNKSKNTWSKGPVVRKSSQTQQPQRPWWDWAGVTEKKSGSSSRRRAPRGRTPQPQRPWWDWAGVTKKK